jgi:hypothetical protein
MNFTDKPIVPYEFITDDLSPKKKKGRTRFVAWDSEDY